MQEKASVEEAMRELGKAHQEHVTVLETEYGSKEMRLQQQVPRFFLIFRIMVLLMDVHVDHDVIIINNSSVDCCLFTLFLIICL